MKTIDEIMNELDKMSSFNLCCRLNTATIKKTRPSHDEEMGSVSDEDYEKKILPKMKEILINRGIPATTLRTITAGTRVMFVEGIYNITFTSCTEDEPPYSLIPKYTEERIPWYDSDGIPTRLYIHL